ncbi:MAG: YitT family protein [Thermosediminibacteraceae bacterium]|nr:YitT family protein [Thermosediminibacteraceae bacterium]
MKLKSVLDYGQIIIGCFVASIGLTMFLVPNKIAAGGVSGLATVLHYLLGVPVGWTMLAFNIPLFIAGVVFLGSGFGAKTILGTLLLSIFTELTKNFPVLTRDLLLSSVYGGIVLGLGLGLVFRTRASTGGSDVAAMLIHHFLPSVSIGQGILLIDFFVIALNGISFNWELAMYSWIALYVSSKVIDIVQEGINYAKAVYIISDRNEEIQKRILEDLGRGITLFEAKGGYTGEEKKVVMCAITRLELPKLKNTIWDVDPRAFIIVHDVHEVLGEGFTHVSYNDHQDKIRGMR